MVTINTIIAYGLNAVDVAIILQLLVMIIPGAFAVRQFVTVPLVKNIEARFLQSIHQHWRQLIIFPALVIFINSGIMTLITTVLKNLGEFPLLTNFLQGWGFKLAIIFPLFFFVVRPLWNKIFAWFETVQAD
ncbi:hypothetical protein JOC36_000079 [Weissella uvarum]|nr:hypothetical protein [Weissella uvarum]MBM7616546.1 hypothetical protein [Weissella uvarum]MCM0594994.1 hypothetical protein [Weissella uvarum]